MAGDLTSPSGWPDGLVDIDDVVFVSVCFGSFPGYASWNPNADITNDDLVDIDDVQIPSLRFGQIDP